MMLCLLSSESCVNEDLLLTYILSYGVGDDLAEEVVRVQTTPPRRMIIGWVSCVTSMNICDSVSANVSRTKVPVPFGACSTGKVCDSCP